MDHYTVQYVSELLGAVYESSAIKKEEDEIRTVCRLLEKQLKDNRNRLDELLEKYRQLYMNISIGTYYAISHDGVMTQFVVTYNDYKKCHECKSTIIDAVTPTDLATLSRSKRIQEEV